jgi:hypothetical protein
MFSCPPLNQFPPGRDSWNKSIYRRQLLQIDETTRFSAVKTPQHLEFHSIALFLSGARFFIENVSNGELNSRQVVEKD